MSIFKCPTCDKEMDDFDEFANHFNECFLPDYLKKQKDKS